MGDGAAGGKTNGGNSGDNGQSDGATGLGGAAAGVVLDPQALEQPLNVIATVSANLAEVATRLGASTPEAAFSQALPFFAIPGMFGDTKAESVWSQFHLAWVSEFAVTTAAIEEFGPVLKDCAARMADTDHAGGRAVGGGKSPTGSGGTATTPTGGTGGTSDPTRDQPKSPADQAHPNLRHQQSPA